MRVPSLTSDGTTLLVALAMILAALVLATIAGCGGDASPAVQASSFRLSAPIWLTQLPELTVAETARTSTAPRIAPAARGEPAAAADRDRPVAVSRASVHQ